KNESLEFSIEGSDPDREDVGKLKLSAEYLPDGATFDSTALTFRWTPTFEQSGDYIVTFTVTDSAGLSDQKAVNIGVNHVNRQPQLEPVADQMIDENQPLSIQLVGSDPDKEDAGNLRFAIDGLPEGAIPDTINGILNWTPNFDQSGQYQLTAILKDGAGGSAKQSFTITVNNVNRPPEFEALSAPSGTENSELRIGLTARDPDKEDEGKLEITAVRLPEGALFDAATGEIVWTPTFEQSGSYEIELQVRDSFGASDNLRFSVEIANLNRPPQIESPGNQSVAENQNLTFEITGSDPDQEDRGKLVFKVTGLPDGATFNPQTRQFSWTPTFDQSGVYELTFDVMDSFGESATASVMITVTNVNRAPQIVSPGLQSGEEGQNISFVLTANDPDKEDQGHLKFSALNLPEGASFDEKSGLFSWTPGYEQSGNYVLQFQVSDGSNEVATVEVTLAVKNVNRSPELKAPEERSIQEGQSLKFKIIAEDPDKEDENKLKVSASGLPPGVQFDPETGEFFWIPGYDQQGEYKIEFSTKDASGTPVKTKVSIRVIDVPEPDKTIKEEPN
ncbi:MAG: putative Ig domain-containing protein, partial [Calditrichia bacterium]